MPSSIRLIIQLLEPPASVRALRVVYNYSDLWRNMIINY